MRVPKCTIPWVVQYREKYRNDPEFREKEKERAKARYVKKGNLERVTINEVEYITSRKFREITSLSKHLILSLTKENILPHKRNPTNNRLLFLEADAYLFRDFLHTFLINPGFNTFEKYDSLKLKQFLFKYSGLYDYKNGVFITNKDDKKESNY